MLGRRLLRPRLAIATSLRWTHARRQLHDNPAVHEATSSALYEASGLLASIHTATGLPWLVTIPLAAIGFRSLIYFYLSKPSRINRQRMADVRNIIHTQTMARITTTGNIRRSPKDIKEAVAIAQKQCYANWGVDSKKRWYPLLQLPLFLFIMEDIRKVTGAPLGLLGAMKQRIVGLFGRGAETPATATANTVAEADSMKGLETSQQNNVTPDDSIMTSFAPQATEIPGNLPADSVSAALPHATFDPSLLNGGPFWCTDLTAIDPTMFLPLAIPTIMCVNAIYSARGQLTASGVRGAFSRFLVILPMAMLFITVKLPAGMLLYWFCSASIGLATQVWVETKHPIHEMGGKDFKPLKRVFRGSVQTVKVDQ